ncbi:Flp family type IVb pilin, partial [Nocardioides sp.]|uniref:Flp family type IVb pilin n=1 Tax=Nocardioides sp. TaxID=35761 RepID=UPI0035618918
GHVAAAPRRIWLGINKGEDSIMATQSTPRKHDEAGASAVEYGLLIAGIAAIIAVAVFAFGGGSNGMFQDSCKTIWEDTSVGDC